MYKVLVVDDEPFMLEGWKTMVDWAAYGFELSGTATDGEEALAQVRQDMPDLVVTDIRMPVLDGIGLIRAMNEQLGAVPLTVIVSAYSEFSYARQALHYRVKHYVLKPLMAEEIHRLLAELSETLDERRLEEAQAGRDREAAAAAAIVEALKDGGQAAAAKAARMLGADGEARCRLLLAEPLPGGAAPAGIDAAAASASAAIGETVGSVAAGAISPTRSPAAAIGPACPTAAANGLADPASAANRPAGPAAGEIGLAGSAAAGAAAIGPTGLAAAAAIGPAGPAAAAFGCGSAKLRAVVEAAFGNRLRCCPFEEAPGRAGLLVWGEEAGGAEFEARLTEAAGRPDWPLQGQAIYCSGSGCGFSSLPELYRQAMAARSRALLGRRAGIYAYRQAEPAAPCRLEDVTDSAGKLLLAIETGGADGIREAARGLLVLLARADAQEEWAQFAARYIRGELLRKFAAPAERGAAGLEELLREDGLTDAASWTAGTLARQCVRAAELLAQRKAARTGNPAVTGAVLYLKRHFRDKIQLQELAERFGFNPVYFGQQFKRETGLPFNDYLHRLRIEEAKKLLRRTDMKVSAIARTLGYHDAEYFTAKFKALTGQLPSAYKKQTQG
ncbi:helix-turn-helix domain-containing protein [Paenibacillus humicola]|uniref:helix-turn-helix domain-containing protein n=1 Tax=Paenibacillus humicola TaxID=3110540 RepID=UPI00237C2922|nr:helix-turn-helix domain-containing protein [Paenibacillus humicola]